ncbi:MAG: hypothetical protein ACREJO_11680 [Phycisphaerales bacterium]
MEHAPGPGDRAVERPNREIERAAIRGDLTENGVEKDVRFVRWRGNEQLCLSGAKVETPLGLAEMHGSETRNEPQDNAESENDNAYTARAIDRR